MDEISELSHEIEFHEKFRGYDPDEVDAYVDQVRKVAALATGRLEELHHRAEAAEALIAAGRVDSAEETLGRTLLLAQQTADELVAGARADAARITGEADERAAALLADAESQSTSSIERAHAEAAVIKREAEDRASRMLAEAETDRRAMIRNAAAEATAAADEARGKLSADVSELTATRDFLSDDIDILERHVRQQRANLALVVSSLTDLVEQPGAFQLDPAPALSGVVVSEADLTTDVSEPAEISADSGGAAEATAASVEAVSDYEVDVAVDDVAVDDVAVDDVAVETDVVAVEAVSVDEVAVEADGVSTDEVPAEAEFAEAIASGSPDLKLVEGTEVVMEPAAIGDRQSSTQDEVINLNELEADDELVEQTLDPEPVPDPTPPRLVTAADIHEFADESDTVDPGPATAPIPVVSSEPLFAEVPAAAGSDLFTPLLNGLSDGDLLSDDNDALAAFFDQDDDEADRSWFGRRR